MEATLKYFPLDNYVKNPVGFMEVLPGDNIKPVIWDKYRKIIAESKEPFKEFEHIERFVFMKKLKKLTL